MTAQEIIARLDLQPHPEGGWYRQTWQAANEGRASGTCIYFLLAAGEQPLAPCGRHRNLAIPLRAPLVLSLAQNDRGPAQDYLLSPDLREGEPQILVPEGHWQAARSTGDYTLVSCTVSPGFQFDGFELAPPGFDIARG
ncbi:cupin domain-containing protein [Parasedimentitalea marina]|nr:cupin domain-containing protein [Parasedimentitalea marina]